MLHSSLISFVWALLSVITCEIVQAHRLLSCDKVQ